MRGILWVSGVNFMNAHNIHPKECVDQDVWNEYGANVAKGLVNVVAMWSPDAIVLGGSMTEKFEMFEDSMKKSLIKYNSDVFELPEVLKSDMGHENGLLGGFVFIKQVLNF